MKKILVFRFSAMGDVVLTLPVIKGVLDNNPECEILLVTKKGFSHFFTNIERLSVLEFDKKNKHKGAFGIIKLFNEIRSKFAPDVVIDLHKVLRSIVLDALVTITGHKIYVINKGKIEKNNLIKTKEIIELKTTIERYSLVFKRAGINHSIANSNPIHLSNENIADAQKLLFNRIPESIKIGIAPFAKHNQKIWGDNKIIDVIEKLSETHNCHFYLFGGGKYEVERMKCITEGKPNCTIVANKLTFRSELALISMLDLFVSMDSANMHFATIQQVPTFTIWGATHPALGFRAFNQSNDFNIQYPTELLPCRPCSVFGNKKCIYDDIRCMKLLESSIVVNKINSFLEARD